MEAMETYSTRRPYARSTPSCDHGPVPAERKLRASRAVTARRTVVGGVGGRWSMQRATCSVQRAAWEQDGGLVEAMLLAVGTG